jgi:hypothetical protein
VTGLVIDAGRIGGVGTLDGLKLGAVEGAGAVCS